MILYRSAEGNDLAREILERLYGRVVELVDSLDSGSSVHCGRAGSSPASPTKTGQQFRYDAYRDWCPVSFLMKTGSGVTALGLPQSLFVLGM